MKKLVVSIVTLTTVAIVAVAGYGVAAPATAPTMAKKVDFPTKGKAISLLVGFAAGGGTDLAARMLSSSLEKELGTPVAVINRAGAGSQVALTELASATPDGYTLGYTTLPTAISIYLNPARKAAFSRKSFQPVALHSIDVCAVAVRSDSGYKTIKDLVDAAKAKPKGVPFGITGLLNTGDLALRQLERVAGIQFAHVQFDGAAPARTALIGGHIEAYIETPPDLVPPEKSGQLRILATLSDKRSEHMPNVPTAESQGIKVYAHPSTRLVSAPAGVPRETIELLSGAIRRSMGSEEHKAKAARMLFELRYLDPDQAAEFWSKMESEVEVLMKEVK